MIMEKWDALRIFIEHLIIQLNLVDLPNNFTNQITRMNKNPIACKFSITHLSIRKNGIPLCNLDQTNISQNIPKRILTSDDLNVNRSAFSYKKPDIPIIEDSKLLHYTSLRVYTMLPSCLQSSCVWSAEPEGPSHILYTLRDQASFSSRTKNNANNLYKIQSCSTSCTKLMHLSKAEE